MQNLIKKYKSEIERYDKVIIHKDSSNEEVKNALKIRGILKGFLKDLENSNNETFH